MATFVYDGDGNRVKSTIDGVTTYFIGGHYEVSGSTVTKYYFAGAQRVAMRSGSTLSYLLTDHLGSTSLTTDSSGALVSELRYKPWGETRYSSGTTATKYQYTGQYSNMSDFGLMFYNARWYDPALGRFAQADTIIPKNQGVQAWDRYAYTNNNPLRYVDPSGHCIIGAILGLFGVSYSCPNETHDLGALIHVPVKDEGGPDIFVPVSGNNEPLIFVPVSGDNLPDIFVGIPEDNGLESFDPAPNDDTLGIIAETDENDENDKFINQLEKSINSLQKRIDEHEEKLNDYIEDPDAYDNLDLLKNAPSDEIRGKIIQGRIEKLQKEINNFQNQLDELRRRLEGLI